MGGSKTVVQSPTPAPVQSASETSAQAIQAQIDSLPKILQAQQQYGPGFSQVELDALKQFGPQFAQTALSLQKEFGPQYQEIERQMNPELYAASDTLNKYLSQTDDQEYADLAGGLKEEVRAAHSMRGLGADSPLGTIDESVQLARLKQSLKDRRLNIALSTAGRQPIGGMPTVQGTSGRGQLVQNVSPSDVFGYQQNVNSTNASIFGSQAGMFNNQPRGGNIFGTMLGKGAGSVAPGLFKAGVSMVPGIGPTAASFF